jgi:hypothetical protein
LNGITGRAWRAFAKSRNRAVALSSGSSDSIGSVGEGGHGAAKLQGVIHRVRFLPSLGWAVGRRGLDQEVKVGSERARLCKSETHHKPHDRVLNHVAQFIASPYMGCSLTTTILSSSAEDYPPSLYSVCGYFLRRAPKIPPPAIC